MLQDDDMVDMVDINSNYPYSNSNMIGDYYPEAFTLFREGSFNANLCNDCEPHFITCSICDGLFDFHTYYESHEELCQQIYQTYQDSDNLVECKECKSFVNYNDFAKHKDTCSVIKVGKVDCSYCKCSFSLSIIEEHEKTCQNILSEMMLLKESIECSFCKEKVVLAHIQSHEVKCQKLKEKQKEIEEQVKLMKVEYPKQWDQEIYNIKKYFNDNLSLITLDKNGESFKFACDLMRKSVPNVNITNVYRVQNKYLWEKYFKERAKVIEEKGSAEENWLFHGTRNNNPKSLYNIGFDISFASDGGSFGRGIYFARQAVYSHSGYCYTVKGKSYIFLAKVITGKPYVYGPQVVSIPTKVRKKGNYKNLVNVNPSTFKKPPLLDESKFIYYDSVTNVDNKNNVHISQMYIVYENDKAYPYYLIEFDSANQGGYNYFLNPIVNPSIPIQPIVKNPKTYKIPRKHRYKEYGDEDEDNGVI